MENVETLVNQINEALREKEIKPFEIKAYYNSIYDDIRIRGHMMGLEFAVSFKQVDRLLKVIKNAPCDNPGDNLSYILTAPGPDGKIFSLYGGVNKSYHTVRNGWYYNYEGKSTIIPLMCGDWIGTANGSKIDWVKQS